MCSGAPHHERIHFVTVIFDGFIMSAKSIVYSYEDEDARYRKDQLKKYQPWFLDREAGWQAQREHTWPINISQSSA